MQGPAALFTWMQQEILEDVFACEAGSNWQIAIGKWQMAEPLAFST
jgi:hypothetical protein